MLCKHEFDISESDEQANQTSGLLKEKLKLSINLNRNY